MADAAGPLTFAFTLFLVRRDGMRLPYGTLTFFRREATAFVERGQGERHKTLIAVRIVRRCRGW